MVRINYRLIYILFLLPAILQGMSLKDLGLSLQRPTHEPIVEPYTPSFSARHRTISNLLKSAVATGLALGISRYCFNRGSSDSPVWISTVISLWSIMSIHAKKRSYLDAILLNPLEALKQNQQARNEWIEAYKAKHPQKDKSIVAFDFELAKQIAQEMEQNFPVFRLGECTSESWGPCLLSRTYQPKYRALYEDKVVAELLNKLDDSHAVQYASFGCGGMFQDFVILVKALAQNPSAKIDIHLIDFEHTPFAFARCLFESQDDSARQVLPGKEFDISSKKSDIVEQARAHWSAKETDSDENILKSFMVSYTMLQNQATQFISFLNKTFPLAELSMRLYYSTEDFLTYTHEKQLAYPDIVTAIDIDDEMSMLRNASNDYNELCIRALEKNANLINIRLAKHNYRKVNLMTLVPNEGEHEPEAGNASNETEKAWAYKSEVVMLH